LDVLLRTRSTPRRIVVLALASLLSWSGLIAGSPAVAIASMLLSVSPGGPGAPRSPDPNLRVIDASTGQTVSAMPITLPGFAVVGGSGLARHPVTDELYAILKVQGTSFRRLVTVDELTGASTDVGDTARRFAGIAFASDGTLYGVTGDGSGVSETLFEIDPSDGSSVAILPLGNGSDGETIAFDPVAGRLYHASGLGTPNQVDGEILETIDPDNLLVDPVTLSGFDYQELTALGWGAASFYAADLGDPVVDDPRLLSVTPGGVVTPIGTLDHVAKGLVLATPSPSVPSLSALPLIVYTVSLVIVSSRSLPR
jgi:hypothetical protein